MVQDGLFMLSSGYPCKCTVCMVKLQSVINVKFLERFGV